MTTKDIFIKRLKSLAWRLSSYLVVSLVAFAGQNLDLLNLSPQLVTIIALVLGEVTKYLNTEKQA